MARLFNANGAGLQLRNNSLTPVEYISLTDNYTPATLHNYVDNKLYDHDPWVQGGRRNCGAVVGSDDIISDEQFARSYTYQNYHKRLGIFYLVGATLPLGVGNDLIVVGAHRSRRLGVFAPQHKHAMASLLPHFQRSLQLRHRLSQIEIERHASLAALSTAKIALVVVTQSARIVFANALAEPFFRTGGGIAAVRGHLCAIDPIGDARLQKTIQGAAQGGIGRSTASGGSLNLKQRHAAPLVLSVYPYPSPVLSGEYSEPLVMIFLTCGEGARAPAADLLGAQYDLTPAEARLARALADGERLQEYADRTGVSIHTVKTQLKQVFQKTGCTRQSELIRQLLDNPIPRGTEHR